MEERFDMVVVGAGPAGEKAAAQAAYFGKSVAVVEDAPALGGRWPPARSRPRPCGKPPST